MTSQGVNIHPSPRGQLSAVVDRCLFAFGALGGEEPGVWTVGVAKRSARPAAIQLKITFARS
jgi:hypothetical protein